ncbi:MAG: preprotein translocase subunit SecG [Candidatus Acidiferrales bacterium]
MGERAYWIIASVLTAGLIYVGVRYSPPVLSVFHVLVSSVLMIVILLQSGRAADLAGAFGGAGSQTAFGPRGAATFLSKATQFLAVVFMLTSLALTVASTGSRAQSAIKETAPATETAPAPTGQTPAPPPAGQQPPAQQPQGEKPPASSPPPK